MRLYKKIVKAYAKINIMLDIVDKRLDGYHNLDMIMQTISLFDTLTFSIKNDSKKNVTISCNKFYIPTNYDNLCYKITKFIFDTYNITDSIHISINKKIPVCAGLGGGSSDAGYTLKFLNSYYNLNISDELLIQYALKFGSDIPFFIYGGTKRCKGKGEIISYMNNLPDCYILIATKNIKISTKTIFSSFDINKKIDNTKNKTILLKAFDDYDLLTISKNIFNSLEVITFSKYKELNNIKNIILNNNSLNSLMSGSGGSIFGIFLNKKDADNCIIELKNYDKSIFTFIAKPIST